MKNLINELKEMKQGILELLRANPSIPNDPTDILHDAKKIHKTMNEIRNKYLTPSASTIKLKK